MIKSIVKHIISYIIIIPNLRITNLPVKGTDFARIVSLENLSFTFVPNGVIFLRFTCLIWAMGTVSCLFRNFVLGKKLLKALIQSASKITDKTVLNICQDIMNELRIHHTVTLYSSDILFAQRY